MICFWFDWFVVCAVGVTHCCRFPSVFSFVWMRLAGLVCCFRFGGRFSGFSGFD